ncbi:MAG: molybdenum cofactor biosynthesis protein MoaE [Planctomycetota bacterium]
MNDPFIDIQLMPKPVDAVPLSPWPEHGGAECVFLGRTRAEQHPDHGALVALHYDSYEAMARQTLHALATSAFDAFDILAVRLHHATGPVRVGEASVLVQVAAGHRDAAFRACRYLIDELKASVPIWKQEVWSDGTTWSDGTPVSPSESRT